MLPALQHSACPEALPKAVTTCLDPCILQESIWRQLQAADVSCLQLSQCWTALVPVAYLEFACCHMPDIVCMRLMCFAPRPSRLVMPGRPRHCAMSCCCLPLRSFLMHCHPLSATLQSCMLNCQTAELLRENKGRRLFLDGMLKRHLAPNHLGTSWGSCLGQGRGLAPGDCSSCTALPAARGLVLTRAVTCCACCLQSLVLDNWSVELFWQGPNLARLPLDTRLDIVAGAGAHSFFKHQW